MAMIICTTLNNALSKYSSQIDKLTLLSEDGGRHGSGMSEFMDAGHHLKQTVYTAILLHGKVIVGWSWGIRNRQRYDIWVYVRPKFRRRGYGEKLYDSMSNYLRIKKKAFNIYPWDKRSKGFFKKIGAWKE